MIKKFLSKALSLTLAVTLISTINVHAATNHEESKEAIGLSKAKQLEKKLEKREKELNKKYARTLNGNYGNVIFENTKIKLDYNYIKNNDIDVDSTEFETTLVSEINSFKNQYKDAEAKKVDKTKSKDAQAKKVDEVKTASSSTGTEERKASVWCGVPAIGWGYVNQDYSVSISDGKFQSVTFLGDSYDTGIKIGNYDHIRSWFKLESEGAVCDIYMKGIIDYSLKTGMVTTEATFLYSDTDTTID